jgi:hypothetical protein
VTPAPQPVVVTPTPTRVVRVSRPAAPKAKPPAPKVRKEVAAPAKAEPPKPLGIRMALQPLQPLDPREGGPLVVAALSLAMLALASGAFLGLALRLR